MISGLKADHLVMHINKSLNSDSNHPFIPEQRLLHTRSFSAFCVGVPNFLFHVFLKIDTNTESLSSVPPHTHKKNPHSIVIGP